MDARIQAALIAAAVTILGVFLRDLAIDQARRRGERQRSDRAIYRSYAKPLGEAATSLLWRLTEVRDVNRGADFLIEPHTRYEQYKLLSTYYRLAALLGWIRALRRELQFLPVHSKDHIAPLRSALSRIEKSLADGMDIERQRAETIVKLWSLEVPSEKFVTFSVQIDTVLERSIQRNNVHRPLDLAPTEQQLLSEEIADIARQFCNRGSPRGGAEADTISQLMDRISIREAWVYRDWQAGIGDYMITAAPDRSGRAYDVIGFAEFESRASSADGDTVRWVSRIASVFDGLDMRASESVDARIAQIRSVHEATASLLLTLAEVEKDHKSQIGEDTLKEAKRVRPASTSKEANA